MSSTPTQGGGRDHPRRGAVIQLFEAEPTLLQHLPDDRADGLRQPVVTAYWLEPGPWRVRSIPHKGALFLLVLDGLISREVTVAGKRGLELLGPRDLIQPSQEFRSVTEFVRWRVVARARLAILDDRVTKVLAEIPGVTPELIGRALRRSRYLSLQLAISSIHPLPRRLHVFLWHLAERWAVPDGEDVALPMPLTHEALAELVGAERPPVTAALSQLRRQGILGWRDDGTWSLRRPPPTAMRVRSTIAGQSP